MLHCIFFPKLHPVLRRPNIILRYTYISHCISHIYVLISPQEPISSTPHEMQLIFWAKKYYRRQQVVAALCAHIAREEGPWGMTGKNTRTVETMVLTSKLFGVWGCNFPKEIHERSGFSWNDADFVIWWVQHLVTPCRSILVGILRWRGSNWTVLWGCSAHFLIYTIASCMVWRLLVYSKTCRCYCWIPKYFSGKSPHMFICEIPVSVDQTTVFFLTCQHSTESVGDRWVSRVGSRLSWARSSYAQRYWWWPLAPTFCWVPDTRCWWNRQRLHGKKLRVYWKNTCFLAKSHTKCRYNHHVPGLWVDYGWFTTSLCPWLKIDSQKIALRNIKKE